MHKLSAVIITFNEERNIERCILSLLPIADEIIVLDSNSTDRTEEICRKYEVQFETRDWAGYAASKNYLNSLANHSYIFSIDADEACSPELQDSILGEKTKGFTHSYSVNRLTNYCGKWIKHSSWYPDLKVRIFPKETSRWDGEYVHEELIIENPDKVKLLEGHLYHYSYYDEVDHKQRADKYSALTAQKFHAKGKKVGPLKPYLSALGRFFSMFILKKGFLDGKMGFRIARISAASNVFKYKELRRLNREERN